MNPTFEEAFAACVQHYVDRGYSEEHAADYVRHATSGVFWLYDIIQKEKELGNLATYVNLSEIIAKEGDNNECTS